jgi:hypothetical protein
MGRFYHRLRFLPLPSQTQQQMSCALELAGAAILMLFRSARSPRGGSSLGRGTFVPGTQTFGAWTLDLKRALFEADDAEL